MEVTLPGSVVVPITAADASQTGHARRRALALANAIGFSELRQGQLGIIVTEAAGNIAAHAGRGELVLCPWQFENVAGMDVLAIDSGTGIADVGRSLEDGFSTAGTLGQGLGAISRLATAFQIYSVPGHGTVLFARIANESQSAARIAADYALGVVCLPITGETACGDAWDAAHTPGRSIYIVADGLGHGPAAAEASQEAIRIFRETSHLTPERILADAHGALAKTRGAAVSIAEVLYDKGIVNYAGVGNVAGSIYSGGQSRSMVSMNGTLGHSIGRIQSFSYPWEKNSALLLHSDGIATRWSMEQYPGLASRHPALIAGVLYRDYCRKRDDATILISRI
ncbi:Stage II sporulation protein E [Granulicella mallensis MP5ACTX8]|uniref:Stage II sporulation protein E n=1 Tax=Granulicella mallensis (strain ATCC BAA-1857 / DSM 23137 / MP5ACTX8) TaxID=682795 RepID=G8NP56_GRAMM|nr:Stage II sporulation protein E [Granulicella mallensis MP5ACTX8]